MKLDDFGMSHGRITLQLIQRHDAKALYEAICQSIETLRMFPASLAWSLQEPNLDASLAFCDSRVLAALNQENFVYVIREQQSHNFLGVMDIHQINWLENQAAVGFWGNVEFKGQGLMTEALQLFVDQLLNDLGFQQLNAFVDVENKQARRLCERANFKLIEIEQAAIQNPVDGSWRDICKYEIVR